LPIEYSITGFLKAAAVSLKISMDSFSRASRTEGDEITFSIVVWELWSVSDSYPTEFNQQEIIREQETDHLLVCLFAL
jgi:hypothetical protein